MHENIIVLSNFNNRVNFSKGVYESINKFKNLENAYQSKEMSYIPVRAWQHGKVKHIVANTTKATTIRHTIVNRVVVLLMSAMKQRYYFYSIPPSFLCSSVFGAANKLLHLLLFILEKPNSILCNDLASKYFS